MRKKNIPYHRLSNQNIATHLANDIDAVARNLVATQAQDYAGAKWSLALRTPGATDAHVEQAVADKQIVRTWSLRGTLHIMAAEDVRWILAAIKPALAGIYGTHARKLELDATTLSKCYKVINDALKGGKHVGRNELMAAIGQKGISTEGLRSNMIMYCAAREGIICCGVRSGKEQTYTLMDEWIPGGTKLDSDEALATLALRYFNSHGPATLPDFTWWSGLRITEARQALKMVNTLLQQAVIDGHNYYFPMDLPEITVAKKGLYLLPGFDEYMLGYKDRTPILAPEDVKAVAGAGNGLFNPTIIVDGRVAGTWKRTIKKNSLVVDTNPFRKLNSAENKALTKAIDAYSYHIGLPVVL